MDTYKHTCYKHTSYKIAFWSPQLDVRGSCDAIYNYADYNEKLLKNKSIIVIPNNATNDSIAFRKFELRFEILTYKDIPNMEHILLSQHVDIVYFIKYGKNDGIYTRKIPCIIHCVFDLSSPHGNSYIAVSKQLARKYDKNDYLPHMVVLKPLIHQENLRTELNIPTFSIVIGRYGGEDTFNLDFVKNTIKDIVNQYENIYFLFGNTPKFYDHPQIIHIPKFTDLIFKRKFINTCDIYIEASTLGHTFGLAQAEFSVFNKPLLVYGGEVWNDNHRKIIKNKGIYFYNSDDLYTIITTFNKNDYRRHKDLNCYRKYNPYNVMKKFEKLLSITHHE